MGAWGSIDYETRYCYTNGRKSQLCAPNSACHYWLIPTVHSCHNYTLSPWLGSVADYAMTRLTTARTCTTRISAHLSSAHLSSATLIIATLIIATLGGCTKKAPEHSQLSEKPPVATDFAENTTVHQSRFSTRARIAYADLAALAVEEAPAEYTDDGQQKICKKVIGLKICGTARWQYTVLREGDVQVSGQDDFVVINVPMRFFGNAGIRGDVAKVLNMDAMNFDGAMMAQVRVKLDLAEDWCPVISTNVTYQWTNTPRLEWVGGIDINLEDKVDEAIEKQLSGLEKRIADAIDCNAFRQTIQAQWKQHSIALDLPDKNTLYLHIEPNGFSFSGIKTEQDKLGLTFALDAQTSIHSSPLELEPLTLPPLSRSDYEPGGTQFNVLIRAPYTQLQSLAERQLKGRVFTESSPAGLVSVVVDTVEILGNPNGVTVNLGFRATLPGNKQEIPGNIFLTATPVLEPFTQKIRLENIELSNILDSALWNTLAAVFNNKIIIELENKAVFSLGPKLTEVSTLIETQLADPARTGGLNIGSSEVNVFLEALIPEQENLAALVTVETVLDIDVPVKALYQQRVKR